MKPPAVGYPRQWMGILTSGWVFPPVVGYPRQWLGILTSGWVLPPVVWYPRQWFGIPTSGWVSSSMVGYSRQWLGILASGWVSSPMVGYSRQWLGIPTSGWVFPPVVGYPRQWLGILASGYVSSPVVGYQSLFYLAGVWIPRIKAPLGDPRLPCPGSTFLPFFHQESLGIDSSRHYWDFRKFEHKTRSTCLLFAGWLLIKNRNTSEKFSHSPNGQGRGRVNSDQATVWLRWGVGLHFLTAFHRPQLWRTHLLLGEQREFLKSSMYSCV